jgi:flavin-dependent dehydrogenase
MLDVLIAGAGPAGSLAAIVLARAGARVLMVDRESFPRHKLCGDTLNPGALRVLHSLGLDAGQLKEALPLSGMILSGPRAIVRAEYGGALGRAVTRRVLDAWLVDEAVRSGARFEHDLTVRGPLLDESGPRPTVRGLVMSRRGAAESLTRIPAMMTIAADGRRSTVGLALGLLSHPRRPRRWAFGAYVTGLDYQLTAGEMHIRGGGYVGIAPIDRERANLCVVTGPRPRGGTPEAVMRQAVAENPRLRERLRGLKFVSPVSVLGPLAVNAPVPGTDGLLLAGDAAGFVDPMTGDGLSLAMRGGVLAATEALRAIETGQLREAVVRLAEARRKELGAKIRFNRFVRRIVSSSAAVELACWGSRVAPAIVRRAVRYAGDVQ